MGLSRVGTTTTVTGYKASGTASGGGNPSGYIGYLADTGLTVETNIVRASATTSASSGTYQTLIDSGAAFLTYATIRQMAYCSTHTKWGQVSGVFSNTTLWLQSESGHTTWSNGDVYDLHGFAKVTPTNWQNCYQWNLIWITGGTGAGQKRLITTVTNYGGEQRFWIYGSWETIPDSTSTYKILYSPLDIVYNNAAAGNIHWDSRNLIPIFVNLKDRITWGDTGGTETGFGWAGLLTNFEDNLNQPGNGSNPPTHIFYNNVNFVLGEFNPTAKTMGQPGLMRKTRSSISEVIFGTTSSVYQPNIELYRPGVMGEETKAVGTFMTAEVSYFSRDIGMTIGWHNSGATNGEAFPFSIDSVGEYSQFRSQPLSGNNFPGFIAGDDFTIIGGINSLTGTGSFHTTFGLGQYWINAAQPWPGASDFTFIDCDFDFAAYMALAGATYGGEQTAWIGMHTSTDTNAWTGDIFWKKTFNVKIVDEAGNPIAGANVRIYDWGKNYDITTQTDADGDIAERTITIDQWNDNTHVVYHNGLYYTCTVKHTSSASTEPGVGASWASYWSQSGSGNKYKWRSGMPYSINFVSGSGHTKIGGINANPFTFEIRKSGYEPFIYSEEISLDSRGVVKVFKLKKSSIYIDQEARLT